MTINNGFSASFLHLIMIYYISKEKIFSYLVNSNFMLVCPIIANFTNFFHYFVAIWSISVLKNSALSWSKEQNDLN